MSKRSVITAIALVAIGIVFGAVIVTSFSGISLSLAETGTRFNTTAPYTPSEGVNSLNDAFTAVSSAVTPTVVYITVKSKAKDNPHGGFWPFGDMIPQPDTQERIQQGSGSGIILTSDGYILTNRHVIDGATDDGIKVTLNDSREFPARLIGEDKNTDIAVIKIEAKNLSAASIGNSENVKVGEWVLAVGNPLGLTSTVTAGIVSAISRNIGIMRQTNSDGYGIENFIQTDAAINPGNSGGALVDLRGQVVGVNTAIASDQGRYIGYGFAVPINLAKVVADALIRDGKFVRGYIGVRIGDVDAKTAKAVGLEGRFNGAIVQSLVEGGAGKDAGLKAGDIIVEVDGKDVQSANELQARVGMHHPGDKITVKVWRDGTYVEKIVKLKGRDKDDTIAANETDESDDTEVTNTKTSMTFEKAGFTVKALDAETMKKFDRKTGVLVTDVKQYSPSYDSNLRPGVVIFEARRGSSVTKIETVADLKKVVSSLGDGDAVLLRVQTPTGDTVFVTLEGPVS